MVGDVGVGKSCLVLQYADEVFTDSFISTIGVDFKNTTENLDNADVRLQVWDTAGQERFRTITSSYYKGAAGAVLVFDLSAQSSFDHLTSWVEDIESLADKQSLRMLVGNKTDLVRQVSRAAAEAFAHANNMQYFETSARDLASTRAPFRALAERIYADYARLAADHPVAFPDLPNPQPAREDSSCVMM